jgi:hypothetical protein
MKKHLYTWLFYGAMMLLFVVFSYVLFVKAEKFDVDVQQQTLVAGDQSESSFDLFLNSLSINMGEPVAMLLLQIIAILLVSRLFGYIFAKMGQPTVIGEILAGIILGPSLLGYFFPEIFHFLFDSDSWCI